MFTAADGHEFSEISRAFHDAYCFWHRFAESMAKGSFHSDMDEKGGGVKKGGRREGRLERGGRGKGGGVPEELTEDSENDF